MEVGGVEEWQTLLQSFDDGHISHVKLQLPSPRLHWLEVLVVGQVRGDDDRQSRRREGVREGHQGVFRQELPPLLALLPLLLRQLRLRHR